MILSGILLTPTGLPYKNSSVRITANNTSEQVLMFVYKDFKTDADGSYEIDVPSGWYSVSVFVNSVHSFTNIGNIEITDDTTQTTINELLMLDQTAHSDGLAQQVAADAASALASKNAASASATQAAVSSTNSANSATASDNSATTSQTSATNSQASAVSSAASASTATTKASESAASATASQNSAIASQASADLAASLLSTKENVITPGTTGQYWRGDKTFQALTSLVVTAPGVGTVAQALPMVSVAQTGATGVGNETSQFTAACTQAIAQGHRRVFIPFPAFTVTDDTDGQGCEIYGSATNLTGHIRNFSALHNIAEFGKNSNDRRVHPVSKTDFTPKLVKFISDNYTQVFVQKKTKGYVLIDLKNNVTTAADSLATSTSDITSHRVTAVTNCIDVIVGYKTASTSTGTWTPINLITGIEEPPETGIQYQYLQASAGTAGVYYEMVIQVPQDGYFNVGFLRSSAAATDVTISVDGVNIDSNFTTVSATANLQIREYKALPGSRTIRITKNLSGGLLNLLGCNFFKLKNARNDVSVSHSGYYRAATTYRDYINSISANGYAIRDKNAEIWGGEYHGGEVGIVEKLLADGNLVSLAVGGVQVCKSLKYIANFTIDYSAHGGAIIQCDKQHEFFGGGYNHEFSFTGTIRAESLFMTLFGVSTQMDKVLSPERVDLAALPDSTRAYFGRQNRIKYGCSTSDQTLTITHSNYTQEDNAKGGTYIYKVISSSYHKYYSGVVDRGDRIFTSASALNVIEVD